MEKLSKHWLVRFRHALSVNEINVLEESRYKQSISIVLGNNILFSHEISSLMAIHDFSIHIQYHKNKIRLALLLYDND